MSKKNIVEVAIKRVGTQSGLAEKLTKLTGHKYTQPHVVYWKTNGMFPANLAMVVANEIFAGEITAYEACPNIKRVV